MVGSGPLLTATLNLLGGTQKSRNKSQCSRHQGRDLNPECSEYDTQVWDITACRVFTLRACRGVYGC
jgi:hypothetical protein